MTRVMVGDKFIKLFTTFLKYLFKLGIVMQPCGCHVDLLSNLFGTRFPLRHLMVLEENLPVVFDHG